MDEEQINYLKWIDDMILIHTLTTLIVIGQFYLPILQPARRWWIRPAIKNARVRRGHYRHLFSRIKRIDPEQFFVYCRMSPVQFDRLLLLVRPFLIKKSHRALKTAERLALTLRYLAHGGSMQTVAWEYGIGVSTTSTIIKETCDAIWSGLANIYLLKPDKNKLSSIAEGFYNRWNFPNCIGAIDGKLINIQCPKKGGTLYYSYKKVHALILMAACDFNYCTLVDIGGYGSQGDRTIFRDSEFGAKIIDGTFNVPEPKQLPNSDETLPHFFVGDEAFPLCTNLMRPYPGRFLDDEKRIFNYRLSRARRTIENAFGILVSRWRIFRSAIIANPDTVDSIVKAAVCLHNYLKTDEEEMPRQQQSYCPPSYVDHEDSSGEVIPGQWRNECRSTALGNINRVGSNNTAIRAMQMRDRLRAYLVSPAGSVEWQYRYVRRGIVEPTGQ